MLVINASGILWQGVMAEYGRSDPPYNVFATTGGGKTETIFARAINPLCWARGFTLVDGKAQNDTARTIWYLARRFWT